MLLRENISHLKIKLALLFIHIERSIPTKVAENAEQEMSVHLNFFFKNIHAAKSYGGVS